MRKDKRYVMIVTSEDGELSLSHFAENPSDGLLVDIVYGDNFEELYGEGLYEGLFYILYETGTGQRIGYGVLDPDGPAEEIVEWEENNLTLQNYRQYTNNSKSIGRSIYTVFMRDNDGWVLREDNNGEHAMTEPTNDLQAVLDRYNSITSEMEIINEYKQERENA